jgi:hypothetical protein
MTCWFAVAQAVEATSSAMLSMIVLLLPVVA